ncbi:MAG: hypothetical protein AAF353_14365 [Pseudomonadota bacterium]
MNEENTITGFDRTDMTDLTDRRLIRDVTVALKQISGKTRKERQRQKIRAALVREHIGSPAAAKSPRVSRLQRFWKKLN